MFGREVPGDSHGTVHGLEHLPFWQPLPYGSIAWYDSFNRRNRIEGIFGNVKSDAAQNVTRGRFRVMERRGSA